ncbi:DNA helicase II [Betaproteobacteria bacterium SCN2]|jgi:DNA helicase-2/ATP-dependent DNA helicase PcrA|nr:DNA helicase II [Betaproteobacteria bacterium SCN2]
MSASFLDSLNPQQREAVTLPHQSALILAGAGSGKTRVLTTRIAWLISTGQVSPLGLMAVTFTNKAAREMLTRISAALPINTRGMWVGTFHGLANRLLRAHHREANLPQVFQILDSQDQASAIKRLLKAMDIDTEKYEPRKVQWFINGQKEAGLRAKDVEVHDEFTRRLAEIFEAYDAQCQREGVVDFAELLLRSYELLSFNEPLRNHYQARFKHILIDEFQDTNPLQYRWLKLFAGPSTAMFAVGDDDQSIYAFRGAETANMREFEKEFAQGRVIKLEQNYRSHGNILSAANELIARNRERLGKNLWTDEGAGEPIRVFEGYGDQDEAGFIVDEVKALHREGHALSDIALLYRSNAQSRVLEHALFTSGIPYKVYGGLRFFERQEVKHALAYLRVMSFPDDDGAFLRIVNFPTRGIGARSLENLQEAARSGGVSLWLAAQAQSAGKINPAKRDAAKGLPAFVTLMEKMREACEGMSLAETLEQVINVSGLADYYMNEKDGQDRLENLNELINAAALFEQDPEAVVEEGQSVMEAFLAHAALEAGEHQAGAGTDALQLMTVHAAKGLEFHSVFITGLEEGLFPHEQSFADADGLEEERRLMYVAITRARRRLYLTHAQSRMLHGQVRYGLPSRFLSELPENLLLPLNNRRAAWAQEPAPAAAYGSGAQGAAGFSVGQNVAHPKFGSGVILGFEGRGGDARVQVRFRDAGTKWLALEYAKLSAA